MIPGYRFANNTLLFCAIRYTTKGWFEKNNDKMIPELEKLIESSTVSYKMYTIPELEKLIESSTVSYQR
jgi:myosin heavy subunit